jgi:hypothetical protein
MMVDSPVSTNANTIDNRPCTAIPSNGHTDLEGSEGLDAVGKYHWDPIL